MGWSDSNAAMPPATAADISLLEFVAEDLLDRVRALRTALASSEGAAAALPTTYRKASEEVAQLEDLALSLAELGRQDHAADPGSSVDLVDALRRAHRRFEERRGVRRVLRVKAPAASTRVLGSSHAVSRLLTHCLEATAVGAVESSPLLLDVTLDGPHVALAFEPQTPTDSSLPSERARLASLLALARRLSEGLHGSVELRRTGGALVAPHLFLRAALGS